jgi:hypothetical protein
LDLFRTVIQMIYSGFAPDKVEMSLSPKIMLPSELFNRKKTGFSLPLNTWMEPYLGHLSSKATQNSRSLAKYLISQF